MNSIPLPVYGGTLHAFPWLVARVLISGGHGAFSLDTTWPSGSSGLQVWMQFLIPDPNASSGNFTLSNALTATTP